MKSDSQVVLVEGLTDRGQVRAVNEDDFVINEQLGLYLVVDGMGGHDYGVIATQMVVNQLQAQLENFVHRHNEPLSDAEYQQALQDIIVKTNLMMYQNNVRRGYNEGKGMGAVIAGLWWIEPGRRALIFNVGDCRLYLYRNNELSQLTVDHTMYQLWQMAGGKGTPPPNNIVIRALGPRADVLPEIQLMEFMDDDILLICSDGLSNMVEQQKLQEVLSSAKSPEQLTALPRQLIAQANSNGGVDNITAIVAGI